MGKVADKSKDESGRKLISQGVVKSLLQYDPDTGIFTWLPRDCQGFNRAGKPVGHKFSSRNGKQYVTIGVDGRQYLAHRLAFVYMEGYMPDEVDHEDGDSLNNKWLNLKDADHTSNMRNTKLREDNSSGQSGVTFNKRLGKWNARINVGGYRKHLGYFDDKQEAISVRKQAEVECGYHQNHGSDRKNKDLKWNT